MKCLICRTADSHRHACDTCLTTTRRRLRELELYAAWLTTAALLAPTRGASGRGAPGYSSRPPIRLDVVVMTDHRTSTTGVVGADDDPQPSWSILGTLHGLAHYIRAFHRHPGPRHITLTSEVGYLLGQLDWCASQPWIVDLADDIRTLHAQARTAAHDQPPKPLGTCLTVGCGGIAYPPPPHSDTTHCTACGRSYTGLGLVKLRLAQEAG